MGLETVELVMDVENTFQISIHDNEAVKVLTVGDLHRLVLGKLNGTTRAACLTAHTFYRARRAFIELRQLPRREVRPVTLVETVVPFEGRKILFDRAAALTGLTMPPLRRPLWLVLAGTVFTVSVVMAVAKQLDGYGVFIAGVCFLAGIIILGSAVARLTRPFALNFDRVHTFGDFVKQLRNHNFSTLAESAGVLRSTDVWETIVDLVSRCANVDRSQIQENTRIIDDLGMG